MSSSPFPRPYTSPHPHPWLKLLGIGPDSSGFTGFSCIGGLPILAKDSDPGTQFGSDGESTRLSHQPTGPGAVERSSLAMFHGPGFRNSVEVPA